MVAPRSSHLAVPRQVSAIGLVDAISSEAAHFEQVRRAFSDDRYAMFCRYRRQDGRAGAGDCFINRCREGAGKIKALVLPHAYSRLAPMAGVA